MLLAQLTDTHILDPDAPVERYVDNNDRLARAVERLNAETVKPEAVLATGDLTDHGSETEMELLVDLLAPLDVPVLPLPGNHDARDTFRASFDMPWATEDSHLGWVVDLSELRIIGLDTLLPGSHGGLFDDEREQWLRAALADSVGPTAIAMHHPPFDCGVRWMDKMHLEGRERFVDLVAEHGQVTRIFCGHYHRPLVSTVAGVTTTVGLSTVQHIELDLSPEAEVAVICDPVGYQLHHFDGSNWVTHNRFIETGEEPIRPGWAANPASTD